jgi:mannose-6-phosphate isomerase-like protein (cupin superfamily)
MRAGQFPALRLAEPIGHAKPHLQKAKPGLAYWLMSIVRAAEAPIFQLPGVTFTALAAPSRGSADVCTWRITVAPGLRSDQAHRLDRAEIFMVTAGELRLTPDGDLLRAGDAAVVPAGEPITLENPTDQPAEAYVAIQAGFTGVMADGTGIDTPPWAR